MWSTEDAALDSTCLLKSAALGLEKAQRMKRDVGLFDVDDLVQRIAQWMDSPADDDQLQPRDVPAPARAAKRRGRRRGGARRSVVLEEEEEGSDGEAARVHAQTVAEETESLYERDEALIEEERRWARFGKLSLQFMRRAPGVDFLYVPPLERNNTKCHTDWARWSSLQNSAR